MSFQVNMNMLTKAANDNLAAQRRPKGNMPARQYLATLTEAKFDHWNGVPIIDLNFRIDGPEWVLPNGTPADESIPNALWCAGMRQSSRIFLEGKYGEEAVQQQVNKMLAGFLPHLLAAYPGGEFGDLEDFMPGMAGKQVIIDVGMTKPTTKTVTRTDDETGLEVEDTREVQYNRIWATIDASNWHEHVSDDSFPNFANAGKTQDYLHGESTRLTAEQETTLVNAGGRTSGRSGR
jgi:hypothetical protein